MEKKFEELNAKYQQSKDLAEQAHALLVEFINETIAACGGSIEMTGYYKTYEEADEAGEDFDAQFPIATEVTDKHGYNHNIYITRLYKKGETFYIDGYDFTDGEWIKGWFISCTDSAYSDLASFIKAVIMTEEPEEEQDEPVENPREDVILVGYQLLDSDRCYPSEFGCWDAFRTAEDAEEYRKECLDPEEYAVVEEWATPRQAKMYHFYARVERSFEKDEKIWIKSPHANRFAIVTKQVEKQPFFNMDKIQITELNTGDEWVTDKVEVGKIYRQVKDSVCPKCGEPLYRGHWSEEDGDPVCIHCDHLK